MAKRKIEDEKELRRKKRKKRRLITGFVIFMITALSVAAVLSVTVLFPIKIVKATGSKLYTEKQIVKSSGISEDNNLFTLSAEAVTENLVRNLPYIDSVELKRELPDKITIVVNDATEYACFYADDVYYVISQGGRVINAYTEQPENTFLIEGCKAKCKVGKIIEFDTSESTLRAFSVRASPKNVIPTAFEKHTIAIVPTIARDAIDIISIINKLISLAGIPNSIAAYIKISLIKPLNGGKPHIANEPIINRTEVFGIVLISPPKVSIFRVCVFK